jgi:nucleoside-diphosphate-sugar epimerase
MTKILIIGAAGFVGSHLVKKINEIGQDEVIAIKSSAGDVSDPATWKALPQADIVIHLASKTFVPDSWLEPVEFFQTNINGAINALEYCRLHHARLIYISSYLYGNPKELPITERAEVKASNPYMQSKKMAEDMCSFYSEYYGVAVTVVRPFNIYGPGQSNKFLIPSIVEQILETDSVKIRDLTPKRDYLYIEDFIEALIRVIAMPQKFEIYNIASGTSYSVQDLIDIVKNITQKSVSIHSEGIRRPNEVMDTRADISKAKVDLGWQPHWSLEKGLKAMIDLRLSYISN